MSDEPRDCNEDSPDDALMVSWQDGHVRAFDLLVERHGAAVFRYLVQITGDRQRAEDAYSETLWRLYRRRGTYVSASTFKAWLFTIARHCAFDLQRARGRYLAALRRFVEGRAAAPQGPASPEAGALQQEQAVRVQRGLARLSDKHREVLELAYGQGLSGPELAEILGLSPRQARDRLAYARRLLRDQLAEEVT